MDTSYPTNGWFAFPNEQVSFPGNNIVGTCAACGGPMLIPQVWAGSPEVYPKPRCGECGKSQRTVARWGPVIEVE